MVYKFNSYSLFYCFGITDVLFQLDDGTCAAHRPLLMCRCDMMGAMFSGDFRESSAKVVIIAFQLLLS